MAIPNRIEIHGLQPARRNSAIAGETLNLAPEQEWQQDAHSVNERGETVTGGTPKVEALDLPATAYRYAIEAQPENSEATVTEAGVATLDRPGRYLLSVSRKDLRWPFEVIAWDARVVATLTRNEERNRDVMHAITQRWTVDLATLLTLATTGRVPPTFRIADFGGGGFGSQGR